jgi:hypothetical protein
MRQAPTGPHCRRRSARAAVPRLVPLPAGAVIACSSGAPAAGVCQKRQRGTCAVAVPKAVRASRRRTRRGARGAALHSGGGGCGCRVTEPDGGGRLGSRWRCCGRTAGGGGGGGGDGGSRRRTIAVVEAEEIFALQWSRDASDEANLSRDEGFSLLSLSLSLSLSLLLVLLSTTLAAPLSANKTRPQRALTQPMSRY